MTRGYGSKYNENLNKSTDYYGHCVSGLDDEPSEIDYHFNVPECCLSMLERNESTPFIGMHLGGSRIRKPIEHEQGLGLVHNFRWSVYRQQIRRSI